jgi:hypothetical protein
LGGKTEGMGGEWIGVVTSNHFNIDTKMKCSTNSFSTVMPRWVKKGQQTNKLPRSTGAFFSFLRNFLQKQHRIPRESVISEKK